MSYKKYDSFKWIYEHISVFEDNCRQINKIKSEFAIAMDNETFIRMIKFSKFALDDIPNPTKEMKDLHDSLWTL